MVSAVNGFVDGSEMEAVAKSVASEVLLLETGGGQGTWCFVWCGVVGGKG